MDEQPLGSLLLLLLYVSSTHYYYPLFSICVLSPLCGLFYSTTMVFNYRVTPPDFQLGEASLAI